MYKTFLKMMILFAMLLPFISFSKGVCKPFVFQVDSATTKQHSTNMKMTNPAATQAEPTTIAFYLQDGVEVLDFAGPMEVFTYAGFRVFTVSKTKEPIISQGVLKITPDYSIEDAPQADIIAVFGGNVSPAAKDPEVINWIKKQQPMAKYFFSVCTGAFLLGQAGILDGLTVTTFHESIASLRKSFPKATVLENVRFVDNGKIITTAGISAGIDGAIHLVMKLRGEQTAKQVVHYMEYDKWKAGEGLIITK
jgi:transcriptional regulator GlxA family with amidase domain